jgi:cytochrome P450 family 4
MLSYRSVAEQEIVLVRRKLISFLTHKFYSLTITGQRYAMLLVKIMLIYLLKTYKFTTRLKQDELKFFFTISLKLVNKHLVKMEKRKDE